MLVPSNKQSWGVRRGMTGEKIRLQRVHSESQRHLIMCRLTVHTQTTGSSYHIFLKVNVSVLTERWGEKKAFLQLPGKNKLVEIFQVMKYVSFPAHCFPRKPSQCLCLVQDVFLQRFLSTSKNQNPTNRISGCPGCFNLAAWLRMTSGLLFIALEYKRGVPRPGHGASQNNKTLEMA